MIMMRTTIACCLVAWASAATATDAPDELTRLRSEIDHVDSALVRLLACRYSIVDRISAVKGDNALPVRDHKRESELLAARAASATALGLTAADTRKIFDAILAVSRARQERRRSADTRNISAPATPMPLGCPPAPA
jgi:chorismate mutase